MSSVFLFCVFILLCQHTFTQFVNVARNKPSRQSSTRGNGFPSRAVDGVKTGDWKQSIHTVVGQPYPWWEVDLQKSYFIHEVRIYFRYDFKWRRNGVQVYTNTKQLQANRGHLCGTVIGKPDGSDIDDITSITCDVTARYVTIYMGTDNGKSIALDFVEAEVYACRQNYYGHNCTKSCTRRHCASSRPPCNVQTGDCGTDRCKRGWKGTDCTQVCRQNYNYGSNCNKLCTDRHCWSSRPPCNVQTGDCGTHKCKRGWKGFDCTQQCEKGVTYGFLCLKKCDKRHCVNNSTCDMKHGKCDGDCQPGWLEPDCSAECPAKTYGFNCSLKCSDRHCNRRSTCNKTNGKCLYGCKSGWAGIDCKECETGVSYGVQCSGKCDKRHCVNNSTCDTKHGKCDGDCQPGWLEPDCSKKCPTNTYGSNCSLKCSDRNCNRESTCNKTNGKCQYGCESGWAGIDCTVCDDGRTYGHICKNRCSERHCLIKSTCDSKTGKCSGGCQPGWTNTDCSQACLKGWYGSSCLLSCEDRHCKDESECNHVDGKCKTGCQSGWTGVDCTGFAAPVMGMTAGITVTCLGIIIFVIVLIFIIRRRRRLKHDNQETEELDNVNNLKSSKSKNRQRKEDGDVVYVNATFDTRPLPEGNDAEDDQTSKAPSGTSEVMTKHENRAVPTRSANVTVSAEMSGLVEVNGSVDVPRSEEVSGCYGDEVYFNVSDVILPVKAVPVRELSFIVERIRQQPGGFETEFKKLSNEFTSSYDTSKIPENSSKNRFRGYYPYDKNRVVLSKLSGDAHSDYINASYVDSYREKNYFIAAQAPNKITVPDFWRMIWEKKCGHIIMLTNLVEGTKSKCEPYWRDTGSFRTGSFIISVTEKQDRSDFVYRKFSVTNTETGRSEIFQHFHFISWPDHGVPDVHDFIHFLLRVRQTKPVQPGPDLVHCSAGVGRTGTYIALHILLDEMNTTGRVDIRNMIVKLRDQRRGLIQTKDQYEVIFIAIIELAKYGDTSLSTEEFRKLFPKQKHSLLMGKKSITQLAQEIESLNENPYQNTANKYMLWIHGHQEFFSLRLPSVLSTHGYLMTCYKKGSEESFWRLVTENESCTIITISSDFSDLIPDAGQTVQHGENTIIALQERPDIEQITEQTLLVHTKTETQERQIEHYCVQRWPPTTDPTKLITSLTTLVLKMQTEDTEEKKAIMLCIVNNILSGIQLDSEVEIFNNVRRFQMEDFTFFCELAYANL